MEDIPPPTKKFRTNCSTTTPAPPIRKIRLAKQVELVVNECAINVQDLNARKKRLRLQFEKDMRKLDREVNA